VNEPVASRTAPSTNGLVAEIGPARSELDPEDRAAEEEAAGHHVAPPRDAVGEGGHDEPTRNADRVQQATSAPADVSLQPRST
jgi:hypothetical protein